MIKIEDIKLKEQVESNGILLRAILVITAERFVDPSFSKKTTEPTDELLKEAAAIVEANNEAAKKLYDFCEKHSISTSPYPLMGIRDWMLDYTVKKLNSK